MKLLLDHVDSPYIRGIGFLYLRYAGDPKSLWGWIQPYLYDNESITVAATSSKNKAQQRGRQQRDVTVGGFVRRLFSSELDFYGTMLPRLPMQVERDVQVKLLFAEKIEERAKKHVSNRKTMDYFKTLGSRVMALYGDDENPIRWYEGLVDRVILSDEESRELKIPKFVVSFPEYGNTETVTLGEMEVLGVALDSNNKKKASAARGNERGYGSYDHKRGDCERADRGDYGRADRRGYERRGYSDTGPRDEVDRRRGGNETRRGYRNVDDRGRTDNDDRRGYGRDDRSSRSGPALPSSDDLYEEVRRRERANVTSRGNQAVARRPQSGQAGLNGSAPYNANRQGSTNNAPPLYNRGYSSNREKAASHSTTATSLETGTGTSSDSTLKKRSSEEIAFQREKKRKLMAKYG